MTARKDPIIVVTGFGRCGTSLIMQMLAAGGIEAHAEPETIGTFYETGDATRLPNDHGWLFDCRGKAVKLIDIHHFTPPAALHEYRFIFIRRDAHQQALSQAKLVGTLTALRPNPRDVRALAAGIRRDEPFCRHLLGKFPRSRFVLLDFEAVLGKPRETAEMLRTFLDLPLCPADMAGVVRARPSTCAADMSLELELIAESAR